MGSSRILGIDVHCRGEEEHTARSLPGWPWACRGPANCMAAGVTASKEVEAQQDKI